MTDPAPATLTVDAHGTVLTTTPAVRLIAGRELRGLPIGLLLEDDGRLGRWRTHGNRLDGVPIVLDVDASVLPGGIRELALAEVRVRDDVDTSAALLDAAFRIAPIGMAFCDTDGAYVRVNDAMCELLGRTPEQIIGRRDQEFTHADDRAADVAAAWRILRGELDRWQCEKRFVRPDGSVVWASANLAFVRDDDGRPLAWVGQFLDITPRKELEHDLREQADMDPLTGLPNRRRLEHDLGSALALTRRDPARRGAVLVIDLDGFKRVNDTHGHRYGDAVLVAVAHRLNSRVRAHDLFARIGGDEFAILLHDVDAEQAASIALDLRKCLDGLSSELRTPVDVGLTVGMAIFDASVPATVDDLLDEADRAMYRGKRPPEQPPLD